MKRDKYEDILRTLFQLETKKAKAAFLDGEIESIDYECNGLNHELAVLRNQLDDSL